MPLVLKRREGESILIKHPDGTEVLIEVASVGDKRVRLVFTAPDYVTIDRDEVDKIRKQRSGEDSDATKG